jgi:SP family general alpha glucoside:H+ symporter-like MFS transporter
MSSIFEPKHDPAGDGQFSDNEPQKSTIGHSEVLVNAQLMNNAYDAEIREHEMGVWQAAKLHPMACFWAFIFCFTIVRAVPRTPWAFS